MHSSSASGRRFKIPNSGIGILLHNKRRAFIYLICFITHSPFFLSRGRPSLGIGSQERIPGAAHDHVLSSYLAAMVRMGKDRKDMSPLSEYQDWRGGLLYWAIIYTLFGGVCSAPWRSADLRRLRGRVDWRFSEWNSSPQ